jgi:hypothetical protein
MSLYLELMRQRRPPMDIREAVAILLEVVRDAGEPPDDDAAKEYHMAIKTVEDWLEEQGEAK